VGPSVKIQFIEINDIQRHLLHEDSSTKMALDAVVSVDPIGTQELDDFLRNLIFDEPSIWVQICLVQIGFVKQGNFPHLYCYFPIQSDVYRR
jgi:hypothetical protein